MGVYYNSNVVIKISIITMEITDAIFFSVVPHHQRKKRGPFIEHVLYSYPIVCVVSAGGAPAAHYSSSVVFPDVLV